MRDMIGNPAEIEIWFNTVIKPRILEEAAKDEHLAILLAGKEEGDRALSNPGGKGACLTG